MSLIANCGRACKTSLIQGFVGKDVRPLALGALNSEFSLNARKNRRFAWNNVAAMHATKLLLFIKALRYHI